MVDSKLDVWDFAAIALYFAAVIGAGIYVSILAVSCCIYYWVTYYRSRLPGIKYFVDHLVKSHMRLDGRA